MSNFLLRVAVVLVSASLTGCSYEMPEVVAGTYLERHGASQPVVRPLTSAQVVALNDWVAKHGGTWSRAWLREYVTYVSPVEVAVQFRAGGMARVHVWPEAVALVGEAGYYRKQVSVQEIGLLKEALSTQ
jgi:hypothetical protein